MRHIGEVVHLDAVELFLRLPCRLCLFLLAAHLADMGRSTLAHPAHMEVEPPNSECYASQNQDVKQYGPPAAVPRRQHFDVERFFGLRYAVAAVCNANAEGVTTCGKIGVICLMTCSEPYPVFVEPIKFIGISDLLKATVVQRSEGYAESVLIIVDGDVWLGGKRPVYRAVLRRLHQLIVYCKVLKHKGYGAAHGSVKRIETGDAVSAAKEERAIWQDARCPGRELVASYAV